MQHFSINFFSLKELNGVCDIGYAENNGDIILEFISIFDFSITEQRRIQQYSKEMEERLSLFIEKYKQVIPAIQQLSKKFNMESIFTFCQSVKWIARWNIRSKKSCAN